MEDTVRDFVVNVTRTLRIADLIDVVLVAFFLYVFMSWMRQSISQSTARGLSVLLALFAGVYLLARFFEMYLIGQVSTILLAIILLAAIVAFQSDLRRLFDRTGAWLFSWGDAPAMLGGSIVNALVESVAYLAEARSGALIAIRGAEPWDRHIQGGVELNGSLSPPLLYSLFDHRTPGHGRLHAKQRPLSARWWCSMACASLTKTLRLSR
jgi:diadenylate cyclase